MNFFFGPKEKFGGMQNFNEHNTKISIFFHLEKKERKKNNEKDS